MKLKELFCRSKNNGPQTSDIPKHFVKQVDLDKKLILSLSKSRIPNLKQIKYLPKFFTVTEKRIVQIIIIVIIIALSTLGGIFYKNHVEYLPNYGGEYTEGLIGSLKYINPILAQTSEVDRDISRLIFSSLLQYNEKQELTPDLAEHYEISDDQKTYTVYLKKNIKWHDNSPLTADDIIFTVKSIQDPEYKSPLAPSLRGVLVEKVDDYKITFTLQEPYAPFLEILTFGILPKHIWNDIPANNANLAEYNIKPIGSGPFKFESLTKDNLGNIKKYTLTRYDNYHSQKPFIKKIHLKLYADFNNAVEALHNKNIEGISFLPNELRPAVAKNKNLNYYSLQIPQFTALFFNQSKNEILKDKNIRQALALSLDKNKILQETLGGEGLVIDGVILPGYLGYNPDIKKYNFNIDEANKILEELKWETYPVESYIKNRLSEELKKLEEEKSKEGENQGQAEKSEKTNNEENVAVKETEKIPKETSTKETEDAKEIIKEVPIEDLSAEEAEKTPEELIADQINSEVDENQKIFRRKDGQILTLTLTTVNRPENVKAVELIKKYWQQIGIKVNLNIVSPNEIRRETIKNRAYEILLYSEIVGSDPDPYPFWHSSQNVHPGLNLAIFVNRHVDELLEEARQTNKKEERGEKYIKFQNILAADIPAIFLYSPTYTYVVDKKIKGISAERLTMPSDRFAKIENWYIKVKHQLNF